MTEVISIRFKDKGKTYYFDPCKLNIPSGSQVIVETSKGLEIANCTEGNHEVPDNTLVPPLRPVIRVATKEDIARAEENRKKEAEAFEICREKITNHGIDMHLIDVEYNFEGSKIIFFFTSDGRVDFRELVKDLAGVFKTRIELRQIGVRDEAKMTGGLGICGRPFCCKTFLNDFHPVSIKMAKVQGLSLNPVKISGTCGRLMCCLKYEEDAYEDLTKQAPKADAFVETPGGKGSVLSVNLLRGYAKVKLEDSTDDSVKTYMFDDLEVLGGKARKAEYLAAKEEGTLAEHGFRPSVIRAPKPIKTYKNDASETFMSDGTDTDLENVPAATPVSVKLEPKKPEQKKTETPQEKKESGDHTAAHKEKKHKKKHKSSKPAGETVHTASEPDNKEQTSRKPEEKQNGSHHHKSHHVQAKTHKEPQQKRETKPAVKVELKAETIPQNTEKTAQQEKIQGNSKKKKKKYYKPYYHKKKPSGNSGNKTE